VDGKPYIGSETYKFIEDNDFIKLTNLTWFNYKTDFYKDLWTIAGGLNLANRTIAEGKTFFNRFFSNSYYELEFIERGSVVLDFGKFDEKMASATDDGEQSSKIRETKAWYNFENNEIQHQLLNIPLTGRKKFDFFTINPQSITHKIMTSKQGQNQKTNLLSTYLTYYYVIGTSSFLVLYLIALTIIQKRKIQSGAVSILKESKILVLI
jgi:hypothetical protein